ncbi:DEKNAAC102475 [Brettanomyces naardenensis]|uniref:DEKNAAC102475 n=1 Tax=Brettanomyces naardenensis TaxID=13370 RepID=A0A448YLF2_BRENA|nr:DEKNAAC102475 [Brettanomyces naardenensis]
MSDRMDVDGGDPLTVLITLREEIESTEDSDLISAFYTLEDLYERKLWYQLSEVLSKSIYRDDNSKPIRLRLFENFVLSFGDKLNQLKLVEFLLLSIDQSNALDSLEYLNSLKERITAYGLKESKQSVEEDINDNEVIQALIFVEIETARIKLEMGNIDEATAMIDEGSKKIDQLTNSVDNRVNASYYRTNAQLMKINGDYSAYYYSSLLFLACITDLGELQNKEQIVKEICVSGLLGEKIYNFGEIIMHEIFQYLKDDWLKQLIVALNNGDLETFTKVVHSKDIQSIPDLASNIEFLQQKICIMSLIEIVFNKPTNKKTVKYSEILDHIPLLKNADDVERMTMKCLSLGLIKGLINQVSSEVEISWIQPRTMTMDQIVNMKKKMSFWSDRVQELNDYMSDAGKELWV